MSYGDALSILLFVLLGILFARVLLRARRDRHHLAVERVQSAAAVVIAAMAIAASQPRNPPPPREPQPDERRRQQSPPFGTPIATAHPDGGAPDGGTSMLAAEPSVRFAGELAVECDATDEHVAGCLEQAR